MTDLSPQRRWIFEPHNGYGSDDPEGNPWPFGYFTRTDPIDPIFELGDVGLRREPGDLRAYADLFLRAVNEREELLGALREIEKLADTVVIPALNESSQALAFDRGAQKADRPRYPR